MSPLAPAETPPSGPTEKPRRSLGRRIARGLGYAAASLAGLVALTTAVVLVGANTGPGRRFIERETTALTGGTVALAGVHGRFPDALKISRIELRDKKGAWLTIENLALDWSPLRMIGRTARIDLLSFDRLSMPRLAETDPAASGTTSSGPTKTGLGLDIRAVDAKRIEIGAPIAGVAAVFALQGHAAAPRLDPLINGVFSFGDLPKADILVDLKRLDAEGALKVVARTGAHDLTLDLTARDGSDGVVAALSGMRTLAPVALTLHLAGPTRAAALDFRATAGSIAGSVRGSLDLLAGTADIAARVDAPALALNDSLSWQSVALVANLKGPYTAPAGSGTLDVSQLAAGGAQVGALTVKFDGLEHNDPQGMLRLRALASGLRLPGSSPALLGDTPLQLDATYAASAASRPVTLTVSHPLLKLAARADTKPALKGAAQLTLPDLAPLAAAGGQKLGGHADLAADFALPDATGDPTAIDLTGRIAALSGLAQAVGLIGPDGRLAAHATIRKTSDGQVATLDTLSLDGRGLRLKANAAATTRGGGTTLDAAQADVALTDLAAAAKMLRGTAKLALSASGPMDDLAAKAHLTSDFGTATMPRGPLTLDLTAAHLPSAPDAHLTASGTLNRAPLSVDVTAGQDKGGDRTLKIARLDWNSVHGAGTLDMPAHRRVPLGTIDLKVGRLADLKDLIGQPISGSLDASLKSMAEGPGAPLRTSINLTGDVAVAPYRVAALKLTGFVRDPEGSPSADLSLLLDRLSAPQISGSLKATVKGPQNALAVVASGNFPQLYGAPGALDLTAQADIPGQSVQVGRLTARARGEAVRLEAPVRISYGKTMGVDRLRATVAPPGVSPAAIDVAGTFRPSLNATVSLKNVTPELAKPFMPSLRAAGTLSADARLTGTLEAPAGHVQLSGRGLKMMSGDAASLPPASIDATADLAGASARIAARANAGPKVSLTAEGTVPTSKAGPVNLRTRGTLDLSLANAVLGANGRQALGLLGFDMTVSGNAAQPSARGTMTLHDGDIQDFAQGLHLAGIDATVVAEGRQLVIQSFTARAGKGTLGLTGSVGAFAPGIPVNLHLTADKAQPIASDLLTALIDADVTVRGQVQTRMDVSGMVKLPHVEINIPNSMPSSVATLKVVRPGDRQQDEEKKAAGGQVIGLDLKVISPGEFYVRGHGLDAEMAGLLAVRGTVAEPAISGGFKMKSGLFSLGGITLNFTEGRVGFDGSGVSHKLDPTLDFVAQRNVNGQTAMLKVGGYASDPKITFESIPSLPQDQILAMLLFGTDPHSLSTTQMAELGAALATLAGGAGFDPLGTVRKTLGLDRLAIGGGSGVGNGGASIEAGKYVMKGVYVGAKQATSGSGTQAQVQVDLTNHLKLNTTVGTGGNVTGFTTPENDPGSSVGLLWQYRY